MTSNQGNKLRKRAIGVKSVRTMFVTLTCVVGLLGSAGVAVGASGCSNGVFVTGASVGLPDCRVFEQVSPVNKSGFAAYPTQITPAEVVASSGAPAISYLNFQAFPGAAGNTALLAAHVSTRTASGWRTAELTPAVPQAEALKIYEVSYAFSEDLTQAVLRVPLVPLVEGVTPGVYNLFVRRADGSYSWVNSAHPTVSAEEVCLPFEIALAYCFEFADISTFAGASADFSHILFESTAQLTAEAPPTETSSLYENSGGVVRLVGILPDGSAAQGSTAGAGSSVEYEGTAQRTDGRVEHAISHDGSRIFWTDPSTGDLYVRENNSQPGAKTVLIAEGGEFWTASSNGSVVFYTKAGDLYEYELEIETESNTKPARTTDLAPGGEVQGVVDASADGSYVYFVAKGQLVTGKGVAGEPNLYMIHDGGTPVFIATLSGAAACKFSKQSSDACDWTAFPPQLEAYVTPDGRHLAFMSTMSLPTTSFPEGYNNIDRNTKVADSEVYEYSAPTNGEEEAGGEGRLLCASCNPSGAPPVGNVLIGGINKSKEVTTTEQAYVGVSTPFYRVRAMSDNGTRVFYSAPSLSGGLFDQVYEYEADGEGSCSEEGGCQYLISEARGTATDQFLGASASGGDVFIASTSRLVSTDQDNLRDVYDARVGGGTSVPPSETPCENNCRQPVAQAEVPPLPSAITGPSGNLPPSRVVASTPLTRAQRLAKALKACRTKRQMRKRASCEAAARHRYGPQARKAKAGKSNLRRRAK
jgi:hypothetical protein